MTASRDGLVKVFTLNCNWLDNNSDTKSGTTADENIVPNKRKSKFDLSPYVELTGLNSNSSFSESENGPVRDALWSPIDDNVIAACGDFRAIRIWDIESSANARGKGMGGRNSGKFVPMKIPKSTIETSSTHEGDNEGMAWSPDGKYLAVGKFSEDYVFIYDTSTLREAVKKKKLSHRFYSMKFAPNGKFLILSNSNGIEIMQFTPNNRNSTLELVTTVYGHTQPCTKLDFSPQRGLMCTIGMDHLVAIWDFQELACLNTWQSEMKNDNSKSANNNGNTTNVAEIKDVKIAPNGKYVGIAVAEEIIFIDMETGISCRKSISPYYRSYSISFNPKYPNLLALGGEALNVSKSNGIVRLVDSK